MATIAVIGGVLALILGMRASKARAASTAWRTQTQPARDAANVARNFLVNGQSPDPSVRAAVAEAATQLDRAAVNAPTEDQRNAATEAAESLRGLDFALEADRLLHASATPPSGAQLGQADVAKRNALVHVDRALATLDACLVDPHAPAPADASTTVGSS